MTGRRVGARASPEEGRRAGLIPAGCPPVGRSGTETRLHLMLATDGSDAARVAEEWITGGRWQTPALVDVVCVAGRGRPRAGWSLQTYRRPVQVAVERLAEAKHLGAQSIANESGRRLQAAGFAVRTWARQGDAADELIEMATRERPDLLVLGPRGRTGWAATLLGSVSDEVLSRSPIPILLARAVAGRRPGVPREVAVITDRGCDDVAAIAWLRASGWSDAAHLTIVSVWHAQLADPDIGGPSDVARDVAAASDTVSAGTVVRYVRVDDPSTRAILDSVETLGVDVLVLARSREFGCHIAAVDIAIKATIATVVLPPASGAGRSASPEMQAKHVGQ